MKILYVDTAVDGHHVTYLSALLNDKNNEYVLVLPEKVESLEYKQYISSDKNGNCGRTFSSYRKWIKTIREIAKIENPDIIHFIYGDCFYRYFGYGLGAFKKCRTIVTMHWVRSSKLEIISTKMICAKVDTVVVHSEYIKNLINGYGPDNIEHIEYPQFNERKVDKSEACAYWGLEENVPTIACIGHTRHDKGLDLLLDALNKVDYPFQLLIAGKEDSFSKEFIEEKIEKYKNQVKLCLKYLTDEELSNALSAADMIALPYRRTFNGASGPLGEGVALDKCIVGANHGNLGDTIEKNHLGYTFESENVETIAEVMNYALSGTFKIDDKYRKYKESLNVNTFIDKYKAIYHLT